jgi:hypothetical protein
MITRPYSCGGMDDDRFMGKTAFRLIRDHRNPAVREACAKALVVAGFDAKAQERLPNEVVLYPGRTDNQDRRDTHQAAYEGYAHAIRPTFPGMASQMLAELLSLQAMTAAQPAPVEMQAPPAQDVERDRHGIPAEPEARAEEMGTGETPPVVGVDRHGFQIQAGKVRDWASEQAALAALAEEPEAAEPKETAVMAGPVQEVLKPAGAKKAVKLKPGGRAPAVRKADLED